MFASFSRSWDLAKVSYGIIWGNKRLLVFPVVSSLALLLILASFVGGALLTGAVTTKGGPGHDEVSLANEALGWGLTFAFYFVSYFTVVFFNAGLTACALRALRGESVGVGDGLSAAAGRLPQIAAWAALSALIGVLLKAIESAHEKAGSLVSALLGSAWSVLTFFAVPVLVVEGVGPLEAIKRSGATLRRTWGTALVGNLSLGLINLLLALPVLLVCAGLVVLGAMSQQPALLVGAIGLAVLALAALGAFSSAADVVFKALLYNFATGQQLPAHVDRRALQAAFQAR